MSRYIDADALEYDTEWSEYHDGFTAYSQMAIDTAPTIDVILCGGCRHWSKAPKTEKGWCDKCDGLLEPNFFCADGEREGER